MAVTSISIIPIVSRLVALALALLALGRVFRSYFWNRFYSKGQAAAFPVGKKPIHIDHRTLASTLLENQSTTHDNEQLDLFKKMFFKLHNLEENKDVLPIARDLLIKMLSETISNAVHDKELGILGLSEYSADRLDHIMHDIRGKIAQQYEDYLKRRRSGSPREMFKNFEEAKWWLEQSAPVRCVDGAWLGHINRVSTPFALRRCTKDVWQVFSEELGDGDLDKHHVYIYTELLKSVGSELPPAHTEDFIHPRHGVNNLGAWRSGVSQLLISLFPHEFLPEILGFNLHFEGITLATLKTAHELKEVKVDPSYFVLHVTIDNADSGHTAIAMQAIVKYLDVIKAQHGDAAVQQAWKRVQAGYILAERSDVLISSLSAPQKPVSFRNALAEKVAKSFVAKAIAAEKVHCCSGLKIGSRTLVKWLEPGSIRDQQWQIDFLESLSNCRPWVKRGDPEGSRLVRESCWGGKMFGAFTHQEVEVMKQWIATLDEDRSPYYWYFIGQEERTPDVTSSQLNIASDYPVFASQPLILPDGVRAGSRNYFTVPHITQASLPKLLPMWFAHQSLLEGFISVPSKTAQNLQCAVMRILRGQYGFGAEQHVVDGMDEARRTNQVGLVEIGLELARACDTKSPASLREVLERWPCQFSTTIMHTSMQPTKNKGYLLGMMNGFVNLHDSVAESNLLPVEMKIALKQIIVRERDGMSICLQEIVGNKRELENFSKGYQVVEQQIKTCF
ncbi:hypothetical protein PT974_05197 [Cladobotryum mycophilum]|uniref:ABC transporter n=1 Tax=Cladobotryum mycophilum TaxID=491253 RepID=A0ABR0SI12_9HYPO